MNYSHLSPLILAIFLCSCSINRITVGTTSGMFYQASEEIETEGNWELFRQAAPANIKLMEGLLYLKSDDMNLLTSAIKGRAGLAFAVDETLWLRDFLAGQTDSLARQQALLNYSRAVNYGLEYLSKRGVEYQELKKAIRTEQGVDGFLDSKLRAARQQDLDAVLFTAQALAAIINLNRTDMLMVAELPLAKGMFDWVCQHRPDINFGACDIFYGAYQAGRPAMLGGNPEKGREHFLAAIERWPENWLIVVSYMQYYLIPMAKEEEFQDWYQFMLARVSDFQRQQNWHPRQMREGQEGPEVDPRVTLYQAIALKRFEFIEEFKDSFF